ncbi:MAG: M23 family metallopeptidase [Anaerolineales bacterium]|nr:M23 family metallopeptidase [Anaerolineales bacterium]
MILESRPATIIAAKYAELPFPALAPMQEFAFDLGITATDTPLLLEGVVFQAFHDHQLVFEERWPGTVLQQKLGDLDLSVAPGTGVALRAIHFLVHGYQDLTEVHVTVLVTPKGAAGVTQGELTIPVHYHENLTDLHFPGAGAWWAIQGNDWTDRHKQEVFSQTYAMDFVKLGEESAFFRGRGAEVEDHYSWNQPVHAAAGGKVAFVIYDMPDLAPGAMPDPRMFRDDPRRMLGNAVAISHGNGEFSYYACLQQASLAVREGQVIRRGALIGAVGNSGLTPGPHLHFHLMNGPNPFIDQGLPAKFSHFSAGGQYFDRPITIPSRMIVIGAGQAQALASAPGEE